MFVKICGLKKQLEVNICKEYGAKFIGFVFYNQSSRNISVLDVSRLKFPQKLKSVAVTVDADRALIDEILNSNRFDFLQLHGNETAGECIELKKLYPNVGIIKAISDLKLIAEYEEVVDFLLLDSCTAGSGEAFDWGVLDGIKIKVPFFLAGGVNISNIQKTLQYTKYTDISSGVEGIRGVKDIQKMADLLRFASVL